MTKLIKNTIVKVYEDPITCEKSEGQAKLLQYHRTIKESSDSELEFWTLRFISDGVKVERFVNVQKH